ncbi:MAG: DUF2807 domain-containing protein [Chitinophagaceae bacterium]|nr:DUF2807 domain-containing protein [Chitinophagaceae bacterium]
MTRFIFSIAVLTMISSIFSSCSKVVGSGPRVSEYRSIAGFSSICLAMDATVNIQQDSFYQIEILAQENIMNEVLTELSGSKLTIRHRNSTIIKSSPITVNISMPSLSSLNVSGSGVIRLQNQLQTSGFDLNVSGSGEIEIPVIDASNISSTISGSGKIAINSGVASSLNSKISGSGDLDMLNVRTNDVNTTTSGSGTTKVYAISTLFAKISGSGNVYYRGDPSVESEISGSGRLIKQY